MATTTTTTRAKQRKVAAILLLGLGVSSLGVASASHLTVTADGDQVASGAVLPSTFLSPDAAAAVKVAYPGDNATTLGKQMTLSPSVTLMITDGGAVHANEGKAQVIFYLKEATVATANVAFTIGTAADITAANSTDLFLGDGSLNQYDRVAVIAQP